jgi:hypothetical protein
VSGSWVGRRRAEGMVAEQRETPESGVFTG